MKSLNQSMFVLYVLIDFSPSPKKKKTDEEFSVEGTLYVKTKVSELG